MPTPGSELPGDTNPINSERNFGADKELGVRFAIERLVQAQVLESLDLIRVAMDCKAVHEFSEAEFWSREALRVARSTKKPLELFERLRDLAKTLTDSGKNEEAVQRLIEAYDMADGIPLKNVHALSAAVNLLDVFTALGNKEKMKEWMAKISVLSASVNSKS